MCELESGSAKLLRVYVEGGVEKVVTNPGTGNAILVLDADTGEELQYREFENDGNVQDIVVNLDTDGWVDTFTTFDYRFDMINKDGTDGCPFFGYPRIRGRFAQYSYDLSER